MWEFDAEVFEKIIEKVIVGGYAVIMAGAAN